MADSRRCDRVTGNRSGRVLIVDDEPDLADLFAYWVEQTHAVEVAYSGHEALQIVDDSVDVILLDRRMPQLSGDFVLSELRERGSSCQILMTTAVDPSVSIIEMEMDAYLSKPISGDALVDAIDHAMVIGRETHSTRQYAALRARLDALEEALPARTLAGSPAYVAGLVAVDAYQHRIAALAASATQSVSPSYLGMASDRWRQHHQRANGTEPLDRIARQFEAWYVTLSTDRPSIDHATEKLLTLAASSYCPIEPWTESEIGRSLQTLLGGDPSQNGLLTTSSTDLSLAEIHDDVTAIRQEAAEQVGLGI